MDWLHQYLLRLGWYRRSLERTRHVVLPGLKGLTLFDLGQEYYGELLKDSIFMKGSALAYRFLLATFPAILFVFSLIPFVPIPNFQNSLLQLFQQILPQDVYDAAETTLTEIISKENKGLLSAGFIASIFLSTNGVSALIKGLSKRGLALRPRSYFARRYTALILTLLITFLLIMSAALGIAGTLTIEYLQKHHFIRSLFARYSLILMQWLLVYLVFFIAIALLYFYGPALKYKRPFFSLGASLAAFFCILGTFGFARYVQHFGSYNKVYGSLGTLIVIMILLYFNSVVLLAGFDLDTSLQVCLARIKLSRPKAEVRAGPLRNTIRQ